MVYRYTLETIREVFFNYIMCMKERTECDGDCKYCRYDYKDTSLGRAIRTFMADCDEIGVVYPAVFKKFDNCYNAIHRCRGTCEMCRTYYTEDELIEACKKAIEMIDNLEM